MEGIKKESKERKKKKYNLQILSEKVKNEPQKKERKKERKKNERKKEHIMLKTLYLSEVRAG